MEQRIKIRYLYKVEIDNHTKVETKPGAIEYKKEKYTSHIIYCVRQRLSFVRVV